MPQKLVFKSLVIVIHVSKERWAGGAHSLSIYLKPTLEMDSSVFKDFFLSQWHTPPTDPTFDMTMIKKSRDI